MLARSEAARGNHGDAGTLAHRVLDMIPAAAIRETSRVRLRDLDADLFTAAGPSIAARELRDRLRALPPLRPVCADFRTGTSTLGQANSKWSWRPSHQGTVVSAGRSAPRRTGE